MAKLIYTDGDSWTAGDILDPLLEEQGGYHINHPENNPYRLPKVWPGKLASLTGTEVLNEAVAGSSNDGIIRRVYNNIPVLLEKYRPEDLFVIIGWTSPERKDFVFKDPMSGEDSKPWWDTLYPAQDIATIDNKNRRKFQKLYVDCYCHEEEYYSRFILQNVALHSFLEMYKIPHLFFNAFYEDLEKSPDIHPILGAPALYQSIHNFIDIKTKRKLGHEKVLKMENTGRRGIDELFLKVYNEKYKKESFAHFINNIVPSQEERSNFFYQFHPTEASHELWAQEILSDIENSLK